MSAPHSGGEWAGYASATVLVLGSIGAGIAWLLRFGREGRRTRAAGLQDWEDKLGKREADLDAAVDARLQKLEAENAQRAKENMALRMAFEIVAGGLRSIDPKHTALGRAEQLLAAAFPLPDTLTPAGMNGQLQAIDRADNAAAAAARRTEGHHDQA